MPISDSVKQFLQSMAENWGLDPEQQARLRQNKQVSAEGRREFEIGQSNKDREFEEQKRQHKQMMDEAMIKAGYRPVLEGQQGQPSSNPLDKIGTWQTGGFAGQPMPPPPSGGAQQGGPDINNLMEQLIPGFGQLTSQGQGAGAATQQGGSGLNATAPTMAEQPGPMGTPRQPPTPQDSMTNLMPLMSMLMPGGGQGQTGVGMNTPQQVSGGMPTPASRTAPTVGGGVTSPAESPVIDFGGGMRYEKIPDAAETMVPTNAAAVKAGFKSAYPMSEYKVIQPTLEKFMAQDVPKTPAGKEADLMKSAAQMTAKEAGLDPTKFNSINDLPLEHQEKAWDKHADLLGGDVAKAAKEARTQNQLDRAKKYQDEKASDQEVLNDIKRDPLAWFSKNIPLDQKPRIRSAAKEAGITLPTREPTDPMKIKIEVANEIQAQVQRMRAIAEALGPQSFGAMIGRMKNAEGDWGNPIFTDPLRASLEQEFRGHSKFLTAQEVQLFGGGRTAVALYNMLKSATPQQMQDMPFLTGSFNSTFNRAQQSKDGVRRYAYGIDEPVGTGRKKGDVVLIKGIPHRLTSDRDKSGNFEAEPIR